MMVLIKTDVIENELPLLLSKGSMKKSNVKIDFENDKVSFLDQNVDIILTSSGHYASVSRMEQLLDNMDSTVDSEKLFLTINDLSSMSSDEKKNNKIAKKLDFQFGHSSSEKLKKLSQSANIHGKELNEEITNVEEQCDICLEYKKSKLRSVVGFSLSIEFNVVAVDMKAMEKVHILHIVDHATRFSAAALVKSKKK